MQPAENSPVLILDRQCIAAACSFGRASLRHAVAAEAPGLQHTPEGAVLRRRAQLYSDLMGDMTKLAGELSTERRPA
ncbi:MAG: hypothetical protein IOC42_01015 [Methylobacterium sp.]|nr:hypothetical protein [Methylobacterium sp.]MCA3668466.1 hypothetical protein [Methylobacterium sp.]MCA3675488.1 hypothetical protein [Methylobacterium sp.]